jgi:hypothetical protein
VGVPITKVLSIEYIGERTELLVAGRKAEDIVALVEAGGLLKCQQGGDQLQSRGNNDDEREKLYNAVRSIRQKQEKSPKPEVRAKAKSLLKELEAEYQQKRPAEWTAVRRREKKSSKNKGRNTVGGTAAIEAPQGSYANMCKPGDWGCEGNEGGQPCAVQTPASPVEDALPLVDRAEADSDAMAVDTDNPEMVSVAARQSKSAIRTASPFSPLKNGHPTKKARSQPNDAAVIGQSGAELTDSL